MAAGCLPAVSDRRCACQSTGCRQAARAACSLHRVRTNVFAVASATGHAACYASRRATSGVKANTHHLPHAGAAHP